MDATRRSLRADPGRTGQAAAVSDSAAPGVAAVRACVASVFDRVGLGGARVAVALSGGRDSMALLDAALAGGHGGTRSAIAAIHVHHGLSPNADAWADFCVDQCRRRGVTCEVRRVSVVAAPRRSLEADAREQRRTALTEAAGALGAAAVLLAHHADDQAETLLLQLLRGAGPRGLGAMAVARNAGGLWWLRPFLDLPRAAIDDYVRACGLAYVEDESNASARHRRNALRHRVIPVLSALAPGYPRTLARAARLQASAAGLLDELAAIDAERWFDGSTLDRRALDALSRARAANLLRWFLRRHALCAPSERRLTAMIETLAGPVRPASLRIVHGGMELGIHRGRILVHDPPVARYALPWSGRPLVSLAHGELAFASATGDGVAAAWLDRAQVSIRSGVPGERLQRRGGHARRLVSDLLREAGVPAWECAYLPRIYCDDVLAAVPMAGVDAGFAAAPGMPGMRVEWQPSKPARMLEL